MSSVSALPPPLLHFRQLHADLAGSFLPLVGVHHDLDDDNGNGCPGFVPGLVFDKRHVDPSVHGLNGADPGHVLVGHWDDFDRPHRLGHRHSTHFPLRIWPRLGAVQRREHGTLVEDGKPLTTPVAAICSYDQALALSHNPLPFLRFPRVYATRHSFFDIRQVGHTKGAERVPSMLAPARRLPHPRPARTFLPVSAHLPPARVTCRGALIAAAAFLPTRPVEESRTHARARSTEAIWCCAPSSPAPMRRGGGEVIS
jgi:hypothetical protein